MVRRKNKRQTAQVKIDIFDRLAYAVITLTEQERSVLVNAMASAGVSSEELNEASKVVSEILNGDKRLNERKLSPRA